MFVTLSFASLRLKSKQKNLQCQFAQTEVFRRVVMPNTSVYNTGVNFVFSVTSGLFNYTMGI